jgi:hypothetical protein
LNIISGIFDNSYLCSELPIASFGGTVVGREFLSRTLKNP